MVAQHTPLSTSLQIDLKMLTRSKSITKRYVLHKIAKMVYMRHEKLIRWLTDILFTRRYLMSILKQFQMMQYDTGCLKKFCQNKAFADPAKDW